MVWSAQACPRLQLASRAGRACPRAFECIRAPAPLAGPRHARQHARTWVSAKRTTRGMTEPARRWLCRWAMACAASSTDAMRTSAPAPVPLSVRAVPLCSTRHSMTAP